MNHAKHATEARTEIDPFSKFIGRLETEIEVYAHYVLHCTPEELTQRVGSALVGSVAEQQLDVASLPNLHQRVPAKSHHRLREVEVGDGAHRNGSSRTGQWWYDLTPEQQKAIKAKRAASFKAKKLGNAARHPSGASHRVKNYWANMTPEERSREMHRRELVSMTKGRKMGRWKQGTPTAQQIRAAKKELFAMMTPQEREAYQRKQQRLQKARSRENRRLQKAAGVIAT